jgi:phosphate starvation-inducible PhoH-like protein
LIDAKDKLAKIKQVAFVYFSAKDVVRHPVVAEIIRAYETDDQEQVQTKRDANE